MNLMNLVRWMGIVLIAWTLVAIGLGASGARTGRGTGSLFAASSRHPVDAIPTSWPNVRGYDLIDPEGGQRTPIRLPDDDRWSLVSVSPWTGPGGEVEAIGHWTNPGRQEFGGWAIFRSTDGVVLSRLPTELLPTARPCWVPGRPRTILFAAGDGRLYTCRLDPDEVRPPAASGVVYASGNAESSEPLVWEADRPGPGEPMLGEPAWSSDPRLSRWVFATLMPIVPRGRHLMFGPSQLWWLEISGDARSIVAAGRLTHAKSGASGTVEERRPNVAVRPDGEVRLVYLERPIPGRSYRLRSASLEFDTRTGRPRGLTDVHSPDPDPLGEWLPAPLVVSADGSTVYGLGRSGEPAALPIVHGGPRAASGFGPVAGIPKP